MCASPSSLSPLETSSPTSSPLLTIETVTEGELPQNQKVTLLSSTFLPTEQVIRILFQENAYLSHLSQGLSSLDSPAHQFKPLGESNLTESNFESISSSNSKDFSNFTAPSIPVGHESTSLENSVFVSETNIKRSSSVELEPNQHQQITNSLIQRAGSLSDRSFEEIQSTSLISRPASITDPIPTPKLTKFVSNLKEKEIKRRKRSYRREYPQHNREMKQITPQFPSQEKGETVSKTPSNHSPNQVGKSQPTLDVKTEASTDLTKDSTKELKTTFSTRQEQPSSSNEFIRTFSEQTPQTIGEFFKDFFKTIHSCSKANQQILAEVFTEVILKMESHQLLQQESLLRKIGSLYLELYILVHTQLEKAYATELVYTISKNNNLNMVYSHHWFTPTNTFAQALHTRLSACQDHKEILSLLNAVKLLLNMRTFHPLSVSMVASFDVLASQKIKHFDVLAHQETGQNELQDINKCKATIADLKTCCWFSLRDSLPNSWSKRTATGEKSTDVQKSRSKIDEIIKNSNPETIKLLAWDLKILDVYFFNQIDPEEFVNLAWTHKQPWMAPHLKTYTSYFNALSNLAKTHILASDDLKLRAHSCEFFIQLSKRLITIGSLNNAFSILAALNSAPIGRLKQTWSEVKPDCLKIKKELDLLFSRNNNFKNYWACIRSYLNSKTVSKETCLVPAVNLFLSRLTFIADLRTILTNESINKSIDLTNESANSPNESADSLSEIGRLNPRKILLLGTQCRTFQRLATYTHQFSQEFLLNKLFFTDLLNQIEEIKKSVEGKTEFNFENELWNLSEGYEATPQKTNQNGQEKLKKRHSTGSLRRVLQDKNKQME